MNPLWNMQKAEWSRLLLILVNNRVFNEEDVSSKIKPFIAEMKLAEAEQREPQHSEALKKEVFSLINGEKEGVTAEAQDMLYFLDNSMSDYLQDLG